jgi:hypothetical protein
MKPLNALAIAALAFLALANPAFGQDLAPGQGATSFAMIGITSAESLRLNVVAFPPNPCVAELGFQDGNGNPVSITMTVNLEPGRSASLTVNGDTLVKGFGQRFEVRPVITAASTQYPPNPCVASAEVVENLLANTSTLVPAVQSYPPIPNFGMAGLTAFQTARLNVVAYPPDPASERSALLTAMARRLQR